MTKVGDRKSQGSPISWLPELDGLRCLASLAVAVVHYTPVTAPDHAVPVLLRKYGDQFATANISVAFFFGLSAFLLTHIELKQRQAGRTMNVWRFYLRRTLRIWPLYFFIIAAGFLLTTPGGLFPYAVEDIRVGRQWGIEHLSMYLTFTSNWSLAIDGIGGYADRATAFLRILWSIAVEEQFYLVFPALLLLCLRKPVLWKKLVVATALLGFGSRIALVWAGTSFSGGKPGGYMYYSTLSYLEVFAAGSLAAAIVTDARISERVRCLFIRRSFSLALVASFIALGWLWRIYLFPPYSQSSSVFSNMFDYAITVTIYPFVGVLIGAILIWININRTSILARFLRTRFMRSLGTLSFGIYMWHPLVQPVTQAMDARYVSTMQPELRMVGVNLSFVLYLSLTVACAGLSYALVEAPVLRWKERLAGHVGSAGRDKVRDDDRNPAYMFPGAVAVAVISALLVAAQN